MKPTRVLALAFAATLSFAIAVPARAADEAAAAPAFSTAQLEEMVSPIALYPDSLMAQVLMASTYPLEIVEASRWLKQNAKLTGDALDEALKEKDWDPSVKGLCKVPDVVHRMNDNLEWTQDLGDAFLAQQSDVLGAVQVMRSKAYEAGNLKTSEQQQVVVKEEAGTQVIVVEQASPQVIYVPTYSPAVVYGPTYAVATPYYPSMYAPPGYGLLAFGAGMAVGAAIWGDCNWGYGGGYHGGGYYGGHNNVNVNVNNYNNFNNRVGGGNQIGSGNNNWNHNPEHRKGVNYKNPQTAQKFGASAGQSRVTRDQARGHTESRSGTGSVSNRAGAGAGSRPGGAAVSDRAGSGAGSRPGGSVGSGAGSRPGSSVGSGSRAGSGASNKAVGSGSRGASAPTRPSSASRPSSSGGAFSRSGSSSMDRAASSRGASSRGGGYGGGSSRGGGGASRGGGGGGGRGGRR